MFWRINEMISIYTIILNYNNFDDTLECVESLYNIKNNIDIYNRIIIVDNASTDGSGDRLKQLYKGKVVFLQADKNIGYAAGNNLGIKYALENNADYICILNNDTVVKMNFIEPCIKYISSHEKVGFLSPVIEEYRTEKVQSTGGDIIFEKGMVTLNNNGMDRNKLPSEIECDYIGGACLLFKSSIIDEIGYIPECYFLFFEETEWCWRAKKAGLHNVCLANTYIKHKGSASINAISGLHSYLMERNRIVFLKRNTPTKMLYFRALLYLKLKYVKKGLIDNKEYFKYLSYIRDGEKNRVDLVKYPFIMIKE